MKKIQLYLCESCGTEYRASQEAQECERRAATAKPSVKVGDIVTARAGFGWYDGDRKWITNADQVDRDKNGYSARIRRRKCPHGDSNCFSPCCTFQFYYVVTHIDSESGGHRPRYHLTTNAMTGKNGYRTGYTYDTGHMAPRVVARVPAHVRKTAQSLLGTKASGLL